VEHEQESRAVAEDVELLFSQQKQLNYYIWRLELGSAKRTVETQNIFIQHQQWISYLEEIVAELLVCAQHLQH
jgi:hypothetical protein